MDSLGWFCRGGTVDGDATLAATMPVRTMGGRSKLLRMAGVGVVNKECTLRTTHRSSECADEPGGTRVPSTCAPGNAWVEASSEMSITSLSLAPGRPAVCVIICEEDVLSVSADFKAQSA